MDVASRNFGTLSTEVSVLEAGKLLKRLQEMRESGYLSDAILREAVKTIKSSDDRYDWVGAYLLNPDENVLWLHNYVGEGTEHARINVGEGVCGTAVAEKKNQNVPDVTKVENYLSCSRRVKSELVILIRASDEILGQIDIDSHTAAAFNDKDEEAIGAVADKLAEVIMAER
jgi:L-methionine (R)-S-oxide reductase